MKRIPLTQSKEALVDDQDYEYLMQWKWLYAGGYARRNAPSGHVPQKIHMSRVVAARMGLEIAGLEVDHINTKDEYNKRNNQRYNLRAATSAQNNYNRPPPRNNVSGFKGVSWCRRDKRWCAFIQVNKKCQNLGWFATAEEAAAAYDCHAKELHSSFAGLNGVCAAFNDRRGTWRNNTSGLRGVTWDKTNKKWCAQLHAGGKKIHLKRWTTKEEAAKAYNEAALKYFGPNAYQNHL